MRRPVAAAALLGAALLGTRAAAGDTCAQVGCAEAYRRHHSCQCNAACRGHRNCCPDFQALCLPAAAAKPAPSAAGAKPAAARATADSRPWYEGLDGVKVIRPDDPTAQATVDAVFAEQDGWAGHFNGKRYAVLLTPGTFPDTFHIPVTYYTSIYGVGASPYDVQLSSVRSTNGANGHATNNFWRSVEGVTLKNQTIMWAVSQGAPIRRSVIHGALQLSDGKGYASGGFIADTSVEGTVMTGMQQQWLFRNMAMYGGIWCPMGWNYVFLGVESIDDATYAKCQHDTVSKVTHNPVTPRIAEKPYLVEEGHGASWKIYVPRYSGATTGVTKDYYGSSELKLDMQNEVFVVRPGMTSKKINQGLAGKKGMLITPGVYKLDAPIEIKTSLFVVLGIGFPTLIPVSGQPAIRIADGLSNVRVAGLLLEAGTPKGDAETEPLLQWGSRGAKDDGAAPSGVASDVFVRVGSFKYQGCPIVRADSMMEINSNDVVLDNVWLWHADHDDCGTDPDGRLTVVGKSDDCFTKNGLVVNGDRVTSYGASVEHIVGGDHVRWNGQEGEMYFYQCELPYHNDTMSGNGGAVAYSVAPDVTTHLAQGAGVYIISGNKKVKTAFELPESAKVQNLMTVVIIGEPRQFDFLVCVNGNGRRCYKPQACEGIRCVLPALPSRVPPQAPAVFFEKRHVGAQGECSGPLCMVRGRPRTTAFMCFIGLAVTIALVGMPLRRRWAMGEHRLIRSSYVEISDCLCPETLQQNAIDVIRAGEVNA